MLLWVGVLAHLLIISFVNFSEGRQSSRVYGIRMKSVNELRVMVI